jgi:hypothetical protein
MLSFSSECGQWLAENRLVSQEGLCFKEQVSKKVSRYVVYRIGEEWSYDTVSVTVCTADQT